MSMKSNADTNSDVYICNYQIDFGFDPPYRIEFQTTDYDLYLYLRNVICREIDKAENRKGREGEK